MLNKLKIEFLNISIPLELKDKAKKYLSDLELNIITKKEILKLHQLYEVVFLEYQN